MVWAFIVLLTFKGTLDLLRENNHSQVKQKQVTLTNQDWIMIGDGQFEQFVFLGGLRLLFWILDGNN